MTTLKTCPDHGDTEFFFRKSQEYWCCCQCYDETSWDDDAWRHQEANLMLKFQHIV